MIPLISTMRETATSTTAEYNMVICYRLTLNTSCLQNHLTFCIPLKLSERQSLNLEILEIIRATYDDEKRFKF